MKQRFWIIETPDGHLMAFKESPPAMLNSWKLYECEEVPLSGVPTQAQDQSNEVVVDSVQS